MRTQTTRVFPCARQTALRILPRYKSFPQEARAFILVTLLLKQPAGAFIPIVKATSCVIRIPTKKQEVTRFSEKRENP